MRQMKNIGLFVLLATMMSGCGLYTTYKRPDVPKLDSTYRDTPQTRDTLSLAALSWRELFADAKLQRLIEQGLTQNTDLRIAQLRVEEAHAALKSARLSFLPSLSFNPQGTVSSFDNSKAAQTYQLALSASWEVDAFGRINNQKKGAKASLQQSEAYCQAVQTQLIAAISNSYYTLLMLDKQLQISEQTALNWKASVQTMRALKQAGRSTEAAVSQAQANYLSVESSVLSIKQQINQVENSLSLLLGESAQAIVRGELAEQRFPNHLATGVPLQLLSNRPDVRQYEWALAQSFYATNVARSAFYPNIVLGGSAGWTNSAGAALVNPGKLLLSALGSLAQPIFNKGLNRAQLEIAKAQQEEALLTYQQSLLNAGADVNDALVQWQTARNQLVLNDQQIVSLRTALRSTQLLMEHGSTTYLEVLTAQQTLLQAELSQISNYFSEIQGVINLYHSLGGGTH